MKFRLFAFGAAAAVCLIAPAVTVPAVAAPGAGSPRLVEETGAFSYVPPPGWRVAAVPGLKYHISYGKPAGGFAPNINVVDETAAVPLAEYARLSLKLLQQRYPGFHLLGQSSFVTRSGVQGVKIQAEATPLKQKVRQSFYLFAGHGDQKWVVTASTLASDGSKYDHMLDAAMKTFTLK